MLLFLSMASHKPFSVYGMRVFKSWDTRSKCEKIQRPLWPFAYYKNEPVEHKGRVTSNFQNLGHTCQTKGTKAKCHRCEVFRCNGDSEDGTCPMQIQGVNKALMPTNIPTNSDTPWAVNGAHRNDFGGTGTWACTMLSGGKCVNPITAETDFSSCITRCWGYGLPTTPTNPNIAQTADGGSFGVSWIWSKKIGNAQGRVHTVAGPLATLSKDKGISGYVDGTSSNARFNSPGGLVMDDQGVLFVADTGNNCIRKITIALGPDEDLEGQLQKGTVSTYAGTCGFKEANRGHANGAANTAQFDHPIGIAFYRDSNTNDHILFVCDSGNHRLRKIVNGQTVFTVSGQKGMKPQQGYRDGSPVVARFNYPAGIAIDAEGIIYVADKFNHLIRRVEQDGTTTTLAGNTTISKDGPGCPPPCLVGVKGHRDGALRYAQFYYPHGLTIGLNRTLLVSDHNRLRRVTTHGWSTVQAIQSRNRITTVGGQLKPGKQDGPSELASFNNPRGLHMTPEGTIYVADFANARIRRVVRSKRAATEVTCARSAFNLLRPSGCAMYDPPTDAQELKASPTAGNIYYNFGLYLTTNDVISADVAGEPMGKRIMNCQGVKPKDTAMKSNGITSNAVGGTSFSPFTIQEDTGYNSRFILKCPPGCDSSIVGAKVQGNGTYTDDSSACVAAVHDGKINPLNGGIIAIYIQGEMASIGSFPRNGITPQVLAEPFPRSFIIETLPDNELVIDTMAGHPGAPLEEARGYENGQPPLEQRFRAIGAVTAKPGQDLTDTEILYIADTRNHAIRAVSASCAKVCENGGVCVADNICSCPAGWLDEDCGKPDCTNLITQNGGSLPTRMVCVAPDTASCIPGFSGRTATLSSNTVVYSPYPTNNKHPITNLDYGECMKPLCVQKCWHGGFCSGPDTCTCADGWFGTNCTVPMCQQTCGNGGNCTEPDTCECPVEWTGSDCRTPICHQTCTLDDDMNPSLNGNGHVKSGSDFNGKCIMPNTCLCPPEWSGHDCSIPVCLQGYMVADPQPLLEYGTTSARTWINYVPCEFDSWCKETNGFDCAQEQREATLLNPIWGPLGRNVSGIIEKPPNHCFEMEIEPGIITPFQKLDSFGRITPHQRFPVARSFEYVGENEWSSPLPSEPDRQVVLVERRAMVQGPYSCANGGFCTQPGQCLCKKDMWTGFDCRIPVCTQGYFEPQFSERHELNYAAGTESRPEHPDGGANGKPVNWADRYLYSGATSQAGKPNAPSLDPATGIPVSGLIPKTYTIQDEGVSNYGYCSDGISTTKAACDAAAKGLWFGQVQTQRMKATGQSKQGWYSCSQRAYTEWEHPPIKPAVATSECRPKFAEGSAGPIPKVYSEDGHYVDECNEMFPLPHCTEPIHKEEATCVLAGHTWILTGGIIRDVHNHPNYFSRYMSGSSQRIEDEHVYFWDADSKGETDLANIKGTMGYERLHTINDGTYDNSKSGWKRAGTWTRDTSKEWKRGKCTVEYSRQCGVSEVQRIFLTSNVNITDARAGGYERIGGTFRIMFDPDNKGTKHITDLRPEIEDRWIKAKTTTNGIPLTSAISVNISDSDLKKELEKLDTVGTVSVRSYQITAEGRCDTDPTRYGTLYNKVCGLLSPVIQQERCEECKMGLDQDCVLRLRKKLNIKDTTLISESSPAALAQIKQDCLRSQRNIDLGFIEAAKANLKHMVSTIGALTTTRRYPDNPLDLSLAKRIDYANSNTVLSENLEVIPKSGTWTPPNIDDLCPFTVDPVTKEKKYDQAPCTGCLGNEGPPTPRDPATNLKFQPTEFDLRLTYAFPYCSDRLTGDTEDTKEIKKIRCLHGKPTRKYELAVADFTDSSGKKITQGQPVNVPIEEPNNIGAQITPMESISGLSELLAGQRKIWYPWGTIYQCDQSSQAGYPDFCYPGIAQYKGPGIAPRKVVGSTGYESDSGYRKNQREPAEIPSTATTAEKAAIAAANQAIVDANEAMHPRSSANEVMWEKGRKYDPEGAGPEDPPLVKIGANVERAWPDGGVAVPRYRESTCCPCSICTEEKIIEMRDGLYDRYLALVNDNDNNGINIFKAHVEMGQLDSKFTVFNTAVEAWKHARNVRHINGPTRSGKFTTSTGKADEWPFSKFIQPAQTTGWQKGTNAAGQPETDQDFTDRMKNVLASIRESKGKCEEAGGIWWGEGYTGIKRSSIVGIKNRCVPINPGNPSKLVAFIDWFEGTRWTNDPYNAAQNIDSYKKAFYGNPSFTATLGLSGEDLENFPSSQIGYKAKYAQDTYMSEVDSENMISSVRGNIDESVKYATQVTGVIKDHQDARVRENCPAEPRDSKTKKLMPVQSKPYQDWLRDCRIENNVSPPPDFNLGLYRTKTGDISQYEYLGKEFPFNGGPLVIDPKKVASDGGSEWFEALRLRYGMGKPIDRTTGGGARCKTLTSQSACEAFTDPNIPDHLEFPCVWRRKDNPEDRLDFSMGDCLENWQQEITATEWAGVDYYGMITNITHNTLRTGCYGRVFEVTFDTNLGNVPQMMVSADPWNGWTFAYEAVACDDDRKIECSLKGGFMYGNPPQYTAYKKKEDGSNLYFIRQDGLVSTKQVKTGSTVYVTTLLNGTASPFKARDARNYRVGRPVLDTDAAYRPRVKAYDTLFYANSRWNDTGGTCIDYVVRGCYNNGTCIAPNTCQCASGYGGRDCSIPLCEEGCKHGGNCTAPNTCTCEKGWAGHDCSVALCAQECNNGGHCVAPDVCKCKQWRSLWRDQREAGGQPLYRDEFGDPQYTGWTGFDCSTPICVNAENFTLNTKIGRMRLGGRDPANPNELEKCIFNVSGTDTFKPGRGGCYMTLYPRYRNIAAYGILFDNEPTNNLFGQAPGATLGSYNVPQEDLDFLATYSKCNEQDVNNCKGSWQKGQGEIVRNDGRTFQSGCVEVKPTFKKSPPGHRNRFWGTDDSHKVKGWGGVWAFGEENFTRWERTSDTHLCAVLEWEEGDYRFEGCFSGDPGFPNCAKRPITGTDCSGDTAADRLYSDKYCQNSATDGNGNPIAPLRKMIYLEQIEGKASNDYEGRRVRQNHIAYLENMTQREQFYRDPYYDPRGEGIYHCYNLGSCISPDMCACIDGYSGPGCRIPLCRHIQRDPSSVGNKVVGCLNNGVCGKKDKCTCSQVKSILETIHPDARDYPLFPPYLGFTGFNGSDCSIPVCVQGIFDPTCRGITPGGEGCFRCKNGGICTAPDICTCPPAWRGYDCNEPTCIMTADANTVLQLGTQSIDKVQQFELNPCMSFKQQDAEPLFNGRLGKFMIGQGNCTKPNHCTCLCKTEDPTIIPWKEEDNGWGWGHDPDEILARFVCPMGFEGLLDTKGFFTTCHLAIKEPSNFMRQTTEYFILILFLCSIVGFAYYRFKKFLRRRYLLKKAERRRSRKSSESSISNGPGMGGRRSSTNVG
jgi:sugar lactone lactonase YvrE